MASTKTKRKSAPSKNAKTPNNNVAPIVLATGAVIFWALLALSYKKLYNGCGNQASTSTLLLIASIFTSLLVGYLPGRLIADAHGKSLAASDPEAEDRMASVVVLVVSVLVFLPLFFIADFLLYFCW